MSLAKTQRRKGKEWPREFSCFSFPSCTSQTSPGNPAIECRSPVLPTRRTHRKSDVPKCNLGTRGGLDVPKCNLGTRGSRVFPFFAPLRLCERCFGFSFPSCTWERVFPRSCTSQTSPGNPAIECRSPVLPTRRTHRKSDVPKCNLGTRGGLDVPKCNLGTRGSRVFPFFAPLRLCERCFGFSFPSCTWERVFPRSCTSQTSPGNPAIECRSPVLPTRRTHRKSDVPKCNLGTRGGLDVPKCNLGTRGSRVFPFFAPLRLCERCFPFLNV